MAENAGVVADVEGGAAGPPDTKRRHRKHRYRKHGYHKTERENARRVEARNFLSGITLDSHLRSPNELPDQDSTLLLPLNRRLSGGTEGVVFNSDLPPTEELHEMAANLFEFYTRSSPVKLDASRSQEYGFDAVLSTPLNRSASVFEATPTPSHEQRRMGVGLHSKPMVSSMDGGEIRYFTNFKGVPLTDNRYIHKK